MFASFNFVLRVLRGVRTTLLVSLFGLLFAFGQVSFVWAQTSAFTYQGRFTDGGAAANGTYEMQFKLFDGASNQVGATITNAAVLVTEGVFTVQLDYGGAAFSGADRFLEIGVRPAGSGNSFTVLAPRQQLTSAVYAIRAGSATSADTANTATNSSQLGGVGASQFVQTGDSRLTDARAPLAGSSNYIQNNPASKQNASFSISGGGGADSFFANSIIANTDYYLGGSRVLYNAGQFNLFAGIGAGSGGLGNAFFGYQAGNQNTTGALNAYFGASAGKSNQDGNNNAFFGAQSGFKNVSGGGNTFVGEDAGNANVSGNFNTFIGRNSGVGVIDTDYNTGIGYSAGENNPGVQNTFMGAFANTTVSGLTNATAIGYNSKVSQSNSLILGEIKTVNGTADTNVGIGTTAPGFRLTVKTPTSSYGIVHTDGTVTVGTYVGGSTGGGWIGTKSNHTLSFFTNDGSAAMTLETSGFLRLNNVDAGGNLNLCLGPSNHISFCSSSLRYKTNLKDFRGGLNVVNRLRPISFTWKEGGMLDLGFGAEEVANVEPLLVTRNPKGEVEGVKYDRITAVLVNAVKEQQEQIKQQQSQLAQQQEQIAQLQRLVLRKPRHVLRRAN